MNKYIHFVLHVLTLLVCFLQLPIIWCQIKRNTFVRLITDTFILVNSDTSLCAQVFVWSARLSVSNAFFSNTHLANCVPQLTETFLTFNAKLPLCLSYFDQLSNGCINSGKNFRYQFSLLRASKSTNMAILVIAFFLLANFPFEYFNKNTNGAH